jgi:hypothetical protein
MSHKNRKLTNRSIDDNDNRIHQKRSDTHIGTIEVKYNIDLNVRSDKELGNYLKEFNKVNPNNQINSLTKLLKLTKKLL